MAAVSMVAAIGATQTLGCITALAASETQLYVANGSATNAARDWQRDLLERNASGSIWRIDLESGAVTRIAASLAWPAGLGVEPERARLLRGLETPAG